MPSCICLHRLTSLSHRLYSNEGLLPPTATSPSNRPRASIPKPRSSNAAAGISAQLTIFKLGSLHGAPLVKNKKKEKKSIGRVTRKESLRERFISGVLRGPFTQRQPPFAHTPPLLLRSLCNRPLLPPTPSPPPPPSILLALAPATSCACRLRSPSCAAKGGRFYTSIRRQYTSRTVGREYGWRRRRHPAR